MASTVDSADVHLSAVDTSPECHVCSASGHMWASVSSGQDKWVVDSGATHHTTPDASKIVNGADYNGPGKLVVGNGHSLDICKTGHAVIPTKSRVLVINDLLHVPSITKNLIYVSKFARDNDVYFEFHAKQCLVKDGGTGEVLLQGQESNGLYQFAGLKEVNSGCVEVHLTIQQGQQGSLCKHELSVVRGAHKVCTDYVMSPTTPSFTMNGGDECEGQLSDGGQNNEGRQEDVIDIGGINVDIQPDATEVSHVDPVDPEIPCAESGVEAAVEQDVQSGDESMCGDRLISGGGDEATADVPEISVTNLPMQLSLSSSSLLQTLNVVTQHSRFRFACMGSRQDALRVIEHLDGLWLYGATITAAFAQREVSNTFWRHRQVKLDCERCVLGDTQSGRGQDYCRRAQNGGSLRLWM
ncbi:hypothetical protein GQ457_10G006340 [Hibiscus cannabinus]